MTAMHGHHTRWLLQTTASPHFLAPPPTWGQGSSLAADAQL